MAQDIIWYHNLDNINEILPRDHERALTFSQPGILKYSCSYGAEIVDINEESLNTFINNILTNVDAHFDYVIADFHGSGVATIIYKNNYIYYTMYDDVFSNPFDFVKIKIDEVILERLRNLKNFNE